LFLAFRKISTGHHQMPINNTKNIVRGAILKKKAIN